jgi:hypothetical protein
MRSTYRLPVLLLALYSLAGCAATAYQDESSDPLTRYRGDCNGQVAVDYEFTVSSDDRDRQGASRQVRCEPDLHEPMPDTGPRVESPIEPV